MSKQSLKTEHGGGASLRAALLLNAAFLALTVVVVRVGFESNDDPTLAAFVDGQMARSTAYIPYINIVLGVLLKLVYAVLGQGSGWFTLCQYLLLFAGFAALCHVLCRRLGVLRGTAAGVVLLLFFALDAYCVISYTKTAAVCTVGGMALLLGAAEGTGGRTARVFGILLALFGFMLRPMEFLPCFGLMGVLCLRPLWDLLAVKGGDRLRGFGRLVLPYVVLLVLAAGLFGVNEWAWSREPWSVYHSFDRVRVAYSDYGRPAYEEMPAAYDELGLSETDVQLLYDGDYFDPMVFSAELMQAVADARDKNLPRPSAGECLGLLLDRAIPAFFANLYIYGFLLILALWLAAGGHSLRDWLCLALEIAVFALAYLYLIRRGRYLVSRVDLGLFLAAASVLALMLDGEKLRQERTLTVFVLLLALGTCHYLMRDSYRMAEAEDKTEARAACETLLKDADHVYLTKLDAIPDGLWSPFEAGPAGYWDRIVLLGGFDCLHPAVMENLALYGVENPYRDCVGNPKVRLIDENIELTLAHIREHYAPTARAVPVAALSEETGLPIYRIVK